MEKITLRQARERRNLTLEQAANELGLTINTVWNYENGKTKPNVSTLQDMLKLYSVEYEQIKF